MSVYGAFGKIPGMGDFFRFETPPGFVQTWDTWVQDGMLAARDSLGEDWQDAYMSAPIWRFTLSPGLAGAGGVTGILMCSVDRVGRQFPLTLMRPTDSTEGLVTGHAGRTAEFEALEDAALDAMDREIDANALTNALDDIAPQPPALGVSLLPGQGNLDIAFDAKADAGASLGAALAMQHYRGPSMWTALTPSGSRLLMYEGLPDAGQMTTLFCPGKDAPSAAETT